MISSHSILIFDGECNLCNNWVNLVIRFDKKQRFKFCTLQSEIGRKLIGEQFSLDTFPETVVLFENGKLFTHSTAALKIVQHLAFPVSLLAVFKIIPVKMRDGMYNWIARNRYKWFGKRQSCRVPEPEIMHRFL
ncbi:MAG TPA: DCC1-like thiol-disulfide oxidoreductase family protein [Bacteroidia bacterium]|nr:DCC1-like thiol-disulfide oxidoreductase family protein [Bacteroidia bacterium]